MKKRSLKAVLKVRGESDQDFEAEQQSTANPVAKIKRCSMLE
jgi:hypothetical protein